MQVNSHRCGNATIAAMPQSTMRMRNDAKAMREQQLIEGVVGGTALLRGASPVQISAIARHCWTIQARRSDLIAPRGVRPPGVFALAFGTVKLALRHADEERVVRLVQAGQTFGEATVLLGRGAGYEARAVTECKLVVIPSTVLLSLIDRDPRTARQVLHTLAQRYFDLVAELESVTMRRGAQRLASYLASLTEPSIRNARQNGACTVRLPASKTLIASRLDMKKETLSRLLRSLADRGLIEVTQRDITILDLEGLAGLVG
jgi:CRP-like cAMP-binding protein